MNGLMNGGSQPYPGKYQDKQQKEGLHRRKHSLRKSQYPRNEERAKASRLRQTTGQSSQGPRRGRKKPHSRPMDNRNRLRERRKPPQIPSHRNQGELRDQLYRKQARARNQRHNEHHQTIRSWRMMER
jgi:hypothetical protein